MIFGCAKPRVYEMDSSDKIKYFHFEKQRNITKGMTTVVVWEYRTDGVCVKEELTMPNIKIREK
jgi:hypothetical protein